MTGLLYLENSYLRTVDTTVRNVQDGKIFLKDTIFYPTGGGQPNDLGKMTRTSNNQVFDVVNVLKEVQDVAHLLSRDGLTIDDEVRCELDWERRYRLMRMHTAAHLVSSVLYKQTGALITGNQIGIEKTRIDFDLDVFEREKISDYVHQTNELIKQGQEVKIYYLKRGEAMKIPGIVKLAGALPPNIEILRVVEIVGLDIQADAGTHVRNTSEIGKIEVVKMENRGKHNRRLYFTLID
jgi:Ser-tRNA(Ala) deacylase AlaX